MSISGIYEILNTANGKRYIGSTVNFFRRRCKHTSDLACGVHHSQRLQRAWNKYGAAAFQFTLLVICAQKDLLLYEQRAFGVMKPEYNTCGIAGAPTGYRHSKKTRIQMSISHAGVPRPAAERARMLARNIGRIVSAATREKIAASLRGKVASDESRRKMSAAGRGKSKPLRSPGHCANIQFAKWRQAHSIAAWACTASGGAQWT